MDILKRHRGALWISVIYLALGALWIVLSDELLLSMVEAEAGSLSRYQTYKGWFFILSTAVLLFFLVRSVLNSVMKSESALSESQARLKHALHELEEKVEQQRLFATAFACMNDGMLIMDKNMTILSANPAFSTATGYSQEELIGNDPSLFRTGGYDESFYRNALRKLNQHDRWSGEIWYKTKDGNSILLWINSSVLRDGHGEIDKIISVFTDITELKKKEKELRRLAHRDTLTGLPNRLLLHSTLDHAIEKAKRQKNRLGVFYIDLVDFKSVNDSLGHSFGDKLLVEVAKRFKARLRVADTLARLGGDEFVILLEDIDTPEICATIAEDLLDSLAVAFQLDKSREVFAEACIGISIYPDNGDTSESLLRSADTAMNRAKQSGGNQYRFYTGEMGESVIHRLELLTALRRGLERRQFQLFYQPQLDLQSGKLAGAESLIRWSHHPGTLVQPDDFIPLAESSGLISPIGAWVIDDFTRQLRVWHDEGYNPGSVTANVSARQFRDLNLAVLVSKTIEKYRVSPEYLGLEITESALMEKPNEVVAILKSLKGTGIRIYLDDFGTGFSSFSYLSRFEIDYLKIDLSFVKNINRTDKDNHLIESMIDIAHNLGMKTIAEGVEDPDQLAYLQKIGCDIIQGYLFCQPLRADKFTEFMQGTLTFPAGYRKAGKTAPRPRK